IVRTTQVVHIADVTTEQAYIEGDPLFVTAVKLGGYRTILAVPMLRERELIGDHHLPAGGPSVHRQTDRAGAEFRLASGHRYRERAAAQRAAPAHERSRRVAGAADRDLGGVAGHFEFARRA